MPNKPRSQEDAEKIQVTFNKSQLELINKFRGIFGNTRAEVVRYIVTNWLLDKVVKNEKRYKK